MGLKLATTFGGLEAPNAYMRILHIEGGVEHGYAVTLALYGSKKARDAGEQPLACYRMRMPWVEEP
jgi:hypothetical protein